MLGTPRFASGFLVLEMLAHDGWSIAITASQVHEEGVHVTARRGTLEVNVDGATIADIALVIFEAARAAKHGEH